MPRSLRVKDQKYGRHRINLGNLEKVINDSIDIERRSTENSALRRNKNIEYSKTDEPIIIKILKLVGLI